MCLTTVPLIAATPFKIDITNSKMNSEFHEFKFTFNWCQEPAIVCAQYKQCSWISDAHRFRYLGVGAGRGGGEGRLDGIAAIRPY